MLTAEQSYALMSDADQVAEAVWPEPSWSTQPLAVRERALRSAKAILDYSVSVRYGITLTATPETIRAQSRLAIYLLEDGGDPFAVEASNGGSISFGSELSISTTADADGRSNGQRFLDTVIFPMLQSSHDLAHIGRYRVAPRSLRGPNR